MADEKKNNRINQNLNFLKTNITYSYLSVNFAVNTITRIESTNADWSQEYFLDNSCKTIIKYTKLQK